MGIDITPHRFQLVVTLLAAASVIGCGPFVPLSQVPLPDGSLNRKAPGHRANHDSPQLPAPPRPATDSRDARGLKPGGDLNDAQARDEKAKPKKDRDQQNQTKVIPGAQPPATPSTPQTSTPQTSTPQTTVPPSGPARCSPNFSAAYLRFSQLLSDQAARRADTSVWFQSIINACEQVSRLGMQNSCEHIHNDKPAIVSAKDIVGKCEQASRLAVKRAKSEALAAAESKLVASPIGEGHLRLVGAVILDERKIRELTITDHPLKRKGITHNSLVSMRGLAIDGKSTVCEVFATSVQDSERESLQRNGSLKDGQKLKLETVATNPIQISDAVVTTLEFSEGFGPLANGPNHTPTTATSLDPAPPATTLGSAHPAHPAHRANLAEREGSATTHGATHANSEAKVEPALTITCYSAGPLNMGELQKTFHRVLKFSVIREGAIK